MHEAATTEITRKAMEAAHRERSQAFSALAKGMVRSIRALGFVNWPQVGTRRWNAPPQGCPAGR